MNPKAVFELFKQTGKEWSEDKAPRLGAALAYYTIFSIAPLLIIILAIIGAFTEADVKGQILTQLGGLVGESGKEAIGTMMESANKPATGAFATVIGIVTLLFGASGVFGQLQDALNTIWEVQPKPGRGILGMLKDRFVSFTMILGIGFLLLVSLVVSTMLAGFGKFMEGFGVVPEIVLQVVNFVVSFGVITLLFALMYKILPDVKIAWRDVWIGAAMTALLFTIGKFLIGLYMGKSAPESSYGAVGSLVALLIWIYYSAQILFFGAEFTQVYANKYGSRMVPKKDAVAITEDDRAEQGIPHEAALKRKVREQERGQPGKARTQPGGASPWSTPGARTLVAQAASSEAPDSRQLGYARAGQAVGSTLIGLLTAVFGFLAGLGIGMMRKIKG